jgi:hypothetical protein
MEKRYSLEVTVSGSDHGMVQLEKVLSVRVRELDLMLAIRKVRAAEQHGAVDRVRQGEVCRVVDGNRVPSTAQ